MNISTFKFTLLDHQPGRPDNELFPGLKGAGFLLFVKGSLNAVSLEFNRPLTDAETFRLRRLFPFREQDVQGLQMIAQVTELKARTAGDKIKLFALHYKARKGVVYQAKQAEKNNVKNVVVNATLLGVYFDNTDYPLSGAKSITDYIKHYNFIRDLSHNGAAQKVKFPNEYDPALERRLTPPEATEYYKHLAGLGWVRDRIRGTWKAPNK